MTIEQLCKKHQLAATFLRRNELTLNTASPREWGMVEKWGWDDSGVEWVKVGMQRAIIKLEDNAALQELRASNGRTGVLLDDLREVFSSVKFIGGIGDLTAIFKVA